MTAPAPSAAQRQRSLALLSLWLVPALWSVNYIVARKAVGVVDPYMLALGRWAIAALVLIALSHAELWRMRAHVLRHWGQFFVLGLLGMVICGAWVYEGARSTSAMNIALIYSFSPVLIGLGAALWLGERFSLRQAVGLVLALAGVVHVVVRGSWAALAQVELVVGDAWILAATVSWAAYALLQKKWPSPLSATARLAAIAFGGVVLLIPMTIWEAMQELAPAWSTQGLWLIVAAALAPGLGAYWIYGWAQKILGASHVATALYLSPLYAGVAAWMVLGEPPGWHHAAGAALILPGIFLVTAQPKTLPTQAS